MNRLAIHDLTVAYDHTPILDRFSLEIESGELLVLLGPSGCGKSTLLSTVSGLVTPQQGTIQSGVTLFFDKKTNVSLPVESRNIGFVFQSYALWPHMRVEENLSFPLRMRKWDKTKMHQAVDQALDLVDMKNNKRKYPNELSGGEKQRVALARALIYQPQLLLLDEPLANLDAHLKDKLVREIRQIQKHLKITMIYVTHDQREAFEIADRIAVMKNGQIMQLDTPQNIYRHGRNSFVAGFIGKNNFFRECDHWGQCLRHQQHGKCQKRLLTIRPEDIRFSENGRYTGVIRQIAYRGEFTEYQIHAYGTTLLITSTFHKDFQVGDRIRFEVLQYHWIDESAPMIY
jgi:ABC-type Fe3+/spermidine/putrescine transport system ATPase subunit